MGAATGGGSVKRPSTYEVQRNPLPPFGETSKCPKCDGSIISTVYSPRGCSDLKCLVCVAECLTRTCQRCHYQWFEAVVS